MSDPTKLFIGRPEIYARYRPTYPTRLYEHLAGLAPSGRRAWDCATGSGQVARDLVDHFEEVIATDISPEQLAEAPEHERITYRKAPAEESGIDRESVDLITVAAALHWFDRPRFYDEARRVLVDGGILAVWSYGVSHLEPEAPELEEVVRDFARGTLEPYWSPGNKLTANRYETVELPFEAISFPDISATKDVELQDFLGYLRSWSASQRYWKQHGQDPVDLIADAVAEHWGPPQTTRLLVWPLFGRIGRKG